MHVYRKDIGYCHYAAMRKLFSLRIIGTVIIIVLVAVVVLVDDVSEARRSAMLMALFGPLGALWIFRLFCLLFIGLALWAIWHDVQSRKRVDRIVAQRNIIDRNFHREE